MWQGVYALIWYQVIYQPWNGILLFQSIMQIYRVMHKLQISKDSKRIVWLQVPTSKLAFMDIFTYDWPSNFKIGLWHLFCQYSVLADAPVVVPGKEKTALIPALFFHIVLKQLVE